MLESLSKSIGGRPVRTEGGPLNNNHIAIAEGDAIIREIEAQLANEKAKLEALGVRVVSVLRPNAKKDPSYFNFPQVENYKEDPIHRNMRPTFYAVLELARLSTIIAHSWRNVGLLGPLIIEVDDQPDGAAPLLGDLQFRLYIVKHIG
jgi:Acetyl-CoA carboxylase, central region